MRAIPVVASLLALTVSEPASGRQADDFTPSPVAPLRGSLVLASDGKPPDCVLQSFIQLAGGTTSDIVLLSGSKRAPDERRWRDLGVESVESWSLTEKHQFTGPLFLGSLLHADGVWLESIAEELNGYGFFRSVLEGVLERGGVVGGAGDGALALAAAHVDDRDRVQTGGFGLLPSSVVRLRYRSTVDVKLRKWLAQAPGSVGWGIPRRSALVVHHGRRVGAMGEGDVTAMIAARNGWPERLSRMEAVDVVDPGDLPPHRLDLLAWLRSAQQRMGPLFPSDEAPTTELKRGTLILHGGSGVGEETFELFVEKAGGDDARIVCIPSAAKIDAGDEPDSYSAGELRDLGCDDVVVLHTTRAEVADGDDVFLAPLRKATGVWIDGGRTYRVMDSYQHTTAHRLIADVLKRGGVVAGSSAGAQVLGDFLVRGNPRTNLDLVFEGYTTGFGLLKGVVIDAHFRQRDRGDALGALVARYPQMLGVGVDEKTALVIEGSKGRVVGEHAVSFFGVSTKGTEVPEVVVLEQGESFDLKRRRKIR